MHKKKWSKRFKKLVSIGAVTIMLVPNGVYAENTTQKREKNIRNNFDTIMDKSNITENKIDSNIDTESDKTISVIVEFNSPALAQSKLLNNESNIKKNIDKNHKNFKSHLNNMKKEKSVSSFEIEHEFTTVYNGVSMKIKAKDVSKLLESKEVKKIWNNEILQLELPKEDTAKSGITPKMNDSVPHIGVDKLHKEGLKGKGIKVGVLDTGVDYNHPDLIANYKGGYDFVDNDNNPMEATYDDWKESGEPEYTAVGSYYTSHGTHVSGTILGNAKSNTESKVLGVAPEADLYGYRVLGPYGRGSTDGIIAGIEKAVTDGMDVINLSLGANVNAPDSPLAIACNNSTLAGVVTVIANGNSGPKPGTVGTPGAAALPISVGASSTSIKLETFSLKTSAGTEVKSTILAKDYKTNLSDFASKEYNLVECGVGQSFDFEGKDLKGKLAIVKRGEIPLVDKVRYAKEAGAVGVLLYNNVDGNINVYVGEGVDYVPTLDIDKVSGEKIVEELKNNPNYKISLSLTGTIGTEGDKLADFSSRGPVINGNIKPDVVAPGVNIRSTYPVYINDKENQKDYSIAYARISGTSMATPHVAGVAALMVQDYKNDKEEYTPEDVKLALMNTAEDLNGEYGVNEMGAGRIDAYEAVNPKISIKNEQVDNTIDFDGNDVELKHNTGSISFGIAEKSDTGANLKDVLTINNNTDKTKTYDVSVEYVPASNKHGGLDAVKNRVKLNAKTNVVANKKKSTKIDINLVIPKDAEQGLYQGYINLVSRQDKNEKYQIPWSVKYLEGGINTASIDRYAMTTNPDQPNPWLLPGIPGTISVNSPIEKLDLVIKDFDTKKDIGYTTSYPGEWFVPGVEYGLQTVIGLSPSVYPINEDGTKENVQIPLKSGKYLFEYRATEKSGRVTSREFPLLLDDESATIEFDEQYKPGTYEISEENFTTEVDPSTGETHTAYWIKGKVDDSSISTLNEMGVKATKQHIMASAISNGMPMSSFSFYVEEDGSFKAGLTKEDVNPMSSLGIVPIDLARNPYPAFPTFNLVQKGTPYLDVSIDKEMLKLNDEFTSSINIKNIDNINEMNIDLRGVTGTNLVSVDLADEFKATLESKGYTAELSDNFYDWDGPTETEISLKIKDEQGNPQDISFNGSIIDVKYKIEDEHYIVTGDMYISPAMYKVSIKDKDGNRKQLSNLELIERVLYDRSTSSLDIINIAEGTAFGYDFDAKKSVEKNIWVEDQNGKRHDVYLDPWTESYIVRDLPASDQIHTMIYEVPGHFKKVGKVIPSITKNEKPYGKYCVVGSNVFNGVALAGDTNQDGAIDIVDAKNIAEVYNSTEKNKIVGRDLDFNGKVDARDMKYVVQNFLEVNEQNKNAKEPQKTLDGKTLDDILKEIGYTS